MQLDIRCAGPGDIAAIEAMERENFSMPQSAKELTRMMDSPDTLLLVALLGDRLVGYVGAYTVCRETDIVTVAVATDMRRMGVGKQLLATLADALSGNSDALFLEVRESNTAARALYTGMGFAEIGKRRGYYSHPTEDAILYKKEIF